MAGPPTGSPSPGLVTMPTPEPLPFPPRDTGGEMGAVGDVGVVAGVFDDDSLGP
jgi:hypothetical protein